MRILAIDTSFEACSVALIDAGRITWREQRIIGKGHAEVFPVMTAAAFAATGAHASDLDRIAVVIGPGAFAGIRVGLSFARGLRLGTRACVIGVTSLAALAASLEENSPIAPVFDARRGQVYAALFDTRRGEVVAPFVATPEEAASRLQGKGAFTLTGSGANLVAPHLPPSIKVSRAIHIDPVAVGRIAAASAVPKTPPSPLYLRPPDAEPAAAGMFDDLVAR